MCVCVCVSARVFSLEERTLNGLFYVEMVLNLDLVVRNVGENCE